MFHLRILFFSLLFQATKSAVEDPETTKEAPSSPVPLNVIITPDLRAQLLSPVTALSEGDLEVVTEGSEDMPGRSLSEFWRKYQESSITYRKYKKKVKKEIARRRKLKRK